MWYTGTDPMTGTLVKVAKQLKNRKLQRFFKPENRFEKRAYYSKQAAVVATV